MKNPWPRRVTAPEIGSAPRWPLVLYFHHVRADIEHYTVLRPEDFAFGLELLRRWFRPFDPACLEAPRRTWPDEPSCLLTFDDGYSDVWDHAVPAMQEGDWRAVMFVSTQQVGTIEQHPDRGPLEHMTWTQLRALRARGHVVASHGVTHRDMSLLEAEELHAEIAASRAELTRQLGTVPDLLAYPFGNEPATLDDRLPPLCFGSAKAPPAPWSEQPRLIRRTYLPAGDMERWPAIVEHWRGQWASAASA